MRRQNSWTDPTIIGEHRGTLWFHRPEINSISGNVVIRPFPSHASKFPPRRLTTWLASPGLIRTRPLHPIERNWLHASHPLTIGEAVDCCGVSLPVPLFGSRSFNERPLCARSGHSPQICRPSNLVGATAMFTAAHALVGFTRARDWPHRAGSAYARTACAGRHRTPASGTGRTE